MKLKYNFVINEVAGSTVAVAVGDDAAKFKGFIKMNLFFSIYVCVCMYVFGCVCVCYYY